METIAWRYKPEFIITALINDEDAGDSIEILPSPATSKLMENYGFIVRGEAGKLTGFGRQLLQGDDWVPAFDITHALAFTFWLKVKQGSGFLISDIFNDTGMEFGTQVFYANNLSASGEIDTGITGSIIELIPDPASIDEKKGALSACTLSASFPPGDYTEIKAGKIMAGAAVDFQLSKAIHPAQTSTGLDFRLLPGGAYIVQLEGSPGLQEQVVFDEQAMAAGIKGIVDIYKDAWLFPSEPREYRINFIST